MKKLISALVLCFILASCEPEGEGYTIEILPVAKVEMQTAFRKDSVTQIPVKYLRPSNCHFYEDFYYDKVGFSRIVAIYNSRLDRDNCQSIENDTITVPLKFKPTELGTYTFKFWRGTTAAGVDEYDEYDAVVNH